MPGNRGPKKSVYSILFLLYPRVALLYSRRENFVKFYQKFAALDHVPNGGHFLPLFWTPSPPLGRVFGRFRGRFLSFFITFFHFFSIFLIAFFITFFALFFTFFAFFTFFLKKMSKTPPCTYTGCRS